MTIDNKDFQSFNKKYNKELINNAREEAKRVSEDVSYQVDFFIEDVISKCKDKIFSQDYPLIIDNPGSFMYRHFIGKDKYGYREVQYFHLPYKKETMFRAIEEMNKNGWKIKIKKKLNPFDLIDDLKAHFKNKTLGLYTYTLVVYND
jgi:hypothetical protein